MQVMNLLCNIVLYWNKPLKTLKGMVILFPSHKYDLCDSIFEFSSITSNSESESSSDSESSSFDSSESDSESEEENDLAETFESKRVQSGKART